jgi:histo-blood group ABO system transferase
VIGGRAEDFYQALAGEEVDSVRLGQWVEAADWLEGCETLPGHLVLRGELEAWEVDQVRAMGYSREARLMIREWPAGGPLPRALDYQDGVPGSGVKAGEELYLKRDEGAKPGAGSSVLERRAQRPRVTEPKKIGVAIIATANYRVFAGPLIRSIRRNFLPGHDVTVFLFTDGDFPPAPGLKVIPVEHTAWPGMAIRRYSIFREHAAEFMEMDYLYYLDADMRVTMQVGEEILGDLVGVTHPGYYDKPREKFTYETRRQSTAFIAAHEGSRYFCGACQGGKTADYLRAVRHLAEKIDEDDRNGIVARWHDESHWNRYLIDHPPSLILSPSYCCYPDGRSAEFEPRISIVLKDAALMRK